MKVLILGGYGTFGGRLARLIADEPRLTVVIAGRSLAQAEAFCKAEPAKARMIPARFDREGNTQAQLAALAPDIVVDASGPFQVYGDPYRLVRAALACGVNYLDLADGSQFVSGIAQFDAEARQQGLFVVSGVSSFPVLTAAVVRRLSRGMERVEEISGGIAPSPYAGVGLNVVRAIAGYAGKPVVLVRDGKAAVGYGLAESRRFTIAPPGRVPLGSVRFSLVDVPDLQVLPEQWPGLRAIWMGAGPVPEILHRVLNLCAKAVKLKLLPSLSRLAPLMHRAINVLRWGEHRGGMFVAVKGSGTERTWHMIAEGDDGPFVPSMACEAIIRRCLNGRPPVPGARPATGDLELEDYEELFRRRAIHCGVRDDVPASAPLYRRLLGEAYDTMPPALRAMHDLNGDMSVKGEATVTRGTSPLARIAAAIVGFPRAGKNVPLRVDFTVKDGVETWTRIFDGRAFHSTQEQGRGRNEWLVCERFGPLCAGMAFLVEDGKLRLIVRRWSLFGIPMPRALAPRGDSYEYEENGRFHFHVEIAHPLTGLIVGYQGWLAPA